MARRKEKDQPSKDAEQLLAAVVKDRGDDIIILIVPSHGGGHPQIELPDKDQWADAALQLFGRLYRGATAFETFQGIWISDDGKELFDKPVFIESLVNREDAENVGKLEELVAFAQRMCRETKQECVAIICNDTIHFVRGK